MPLHISISEDKTKEQRQHLVSLRELVPQHNTNFPNNKQRIKYINGAPTIVYENQDQGNNSKN